MPPIAHFMLQSQLTALLYTGPPLPRPDVPGGAIPSRISRRVGGDSMDGTDSATWGLWGTALQMNPQARSGKAGAGAAGGWSTGGKAGPDKSRGKGLVDLGAAASAAGLAAPAVSQGVSVLPLLLPSQLCLARTRFEKMALFWPAVVLSAHDDVKKVIPDPPALPVAPGAASAAAAKKEYLYPVRFINASEDWEVGGTRRWREREGTACTSCHAPVCQPVHRDFVHVRTVWRCISCGSAR